MIEDRIIEAICSRERGVNRRVLKEVVVLAVEIAREGREGRKIGSLFTVGDVAAVLKNSRAMILDPLYGHPESKRHIEDPDLRETLKELAQLDGAFVVSDDGIVVSACRYLNASSLGVELPMGLGARHMAAASITKQTRAVAIVVSETAIVRLFDNGELVAEIIPELWMLRQQTRHISGPRARTRQSEHMTVVSKEE